MRTKSNKLKTNIKIPNNYSKAEKEKIIKLKKKYPNLIIPEIDKNTGSIILPAAILDNW